jgi:hypothetical protein
MNGVKIIRTKIPQIASMKQKKALILLHCSKKGLT